MRESILSFSMLEKLCPGKFAYPASTAQVLDQLSRRGVHITSPNIERLLRIHQLGVPLLGKTRAWGAHQVESLLDAIVRDALEPGNILVDEGGMRQTALPSWMTLFAAKFFALGVSADEWAEKHLAFEAAHPEAGRDERGHHRFMPWYGIPSGAKLVAFNSPESGDLVFNFEPLVVAEKPVLGDEKKGQRKTVKKKGGK